MIKVLEKRVLVEEIKTKVEKKIILKEDSKDVEFTITYKVIDVGPEVKDIKVGDTPCISVFAKPHYVDIIEKDKNKSVYHCVYYSHDIVGIEEVKKQ